MSNKIFRNRLESVFIFLGKQETQAANISQKGTKDTNNKQRYLFGPR